MQDEIWVFGYGSLIFRADFPYVAREQANVRGWVRRFWQGSHDHRGLPEAPGRVVTLIPEAAAICTGMAYRVSLETLVLLDYREKNGYQRVDVLLEFDNGMQQKGIVYVADESNPAFLGDASMEEIALHIARSAGPSGTNLDYLFDLHRALLTLGSQDQHVNDLVALLFNAEQHKRQDGCLI